MFARAIFPHCQMSVEYIRIWRYLIHLIYLKIFHPFGVNENYDNVVIEYRCELDPDYFNQLTHHLNRSINYYSEDNLNKLIHHKDMNSGGFISLLHVTIRSTSSCQCIKLYVLYEWCWPMLLSDCFSETRLSPFTIDTYGTKRYNYFGLTRTIGKGGGASLYIAKTLYTLNSPNLI